MKRLVLLLAGLFATCACWAQGAAATATEAPPKGFWADPIADPMLPIYIVFFFIIVTVLLILLVSIYLLRVLNMLVQQAAEERAAKLGIPYVPQQSWIGSMWQRMNAAVPVQEEKSIEMDHSYDGIRELDNHLPPWWKWLFIGTAVWAVVYFLVYHVFDSMPLQQDEYEQEVAIAESAQRAFKASQPVESVDVNTLVYSNDVRLLQKGKAVFDINCNSCHRNDGGGGIGPNLTDDYWLHGGDLKSIFHTIQDGVLEKGMPAWGKNLSPQEVRDVTFFVMSLKGTNPANAKTPQGDLYKPADVAPAADSTATAVVPAQASAAL